MSIIEVNHVTKEFRLGQLGSLKQSALDAIRRMRGQPIPEQAPFKALDDIDFKVEQGEVVGIIGQNGAGKTTLLKLLARISVPTHGSVSVRGSVAPLIEVGAGMVPDLTGRENVFLNAAILGMRRAEIVKKFDEIVAFAELEEFIDTPIKRYSSGMQVRLGFSIATTVEAEVLIVDEVLAVGDLAFQRKSYDRMNELIRHRQKTVLLVSHNIRQVERICSRVLLLDHGRLQHDGAPREVCNDFYERSDEKIRVLAESSGSKLRRKVVKTNDVELIRVEIVDRAGNATKTIDYMGELSAVFHLRCHTDVPRPTFGFGVHTTDFVYVASADTQHSFSAQVIPAGEFCIRCNVSRFPLLPGVYSIRFGLSTGEVVLYYGEALAHFTVRSNTLNLSYAKEQGFVALETDWNIVENKQPSTAGQEASVVRDS
jgi:lipopolysaccharide transport system ATP-binding protein